MSPDLDARELAELASELHAAPTITETADQVVAYVREQLEADEAGITILQRGHPLRTIAPSSPLVTEADRLQNELEEGSCFDAAWDSETMCAPSLATDPRWPRWGPHAASLGLASALGVALSDTDGRRIGALNLYWSRERGFSQDDIAFAHVFGRHAAIAMSSMLKEANLRTALDTRKLIGQAQGILMERFDLTVDQAFAVLRRYSQDRNRKLRTVAEGLVATRRLPGAATSLSREADAAPARASEGIVTGELS